MGHESEGLKACVELLCDYKDPQQTGFGVPGVTHRRDLGLGYKRPEGRQALKPEPPAGLSSSTPLPIRAASTALCHLPAEQFQQPALPALTANPGTLAGASQLLGATHRETAQPTCLPALSRPEKTTLAPLPSPT